MSLLEHPEAQALLNDATASPMGWDGFGLIHHPAPDFFESALLW